MTNAIKLFVAYIKEILNLLDGVTFNFFGADVSYLALIIVLIMVSMTLTVFWKGAKG